ncbi:protein PAXX isoform X3 [Numida meleagris]|uniref:protein PAXX isoform X3 n=1 Tax=Numida meleagris TaxID=8996 RepID=UPI000B3E2CA1|nr:protein PAXX isoform X3 [Numida meleagris]
MAEPSGPFWVLRDGSGRYLCYCRPAPGPGSAATVFVTDALEVWAGRLGGDAPEDGVAELRAALGRGAVSLGLRDGTATLRLWEGHEALLLPRLPAAEARPQLQALLFAMAARVRDLEERLEASRRAPPGASSLSCQTPVPERTGLLALLCQRRGRSRESPSLTLASKASLLHLEWTLKTRDLRCPIHPTAALSATHAH